MTCAGVLCFDVYSTRGTSNIQCNGGWHVVVAREKDKERERKRDRETIKGSLAKRDRDRD